MTSRPIVAGMLVAAALLGTEHAILAQQATQPVHHTRAHRHHASWRKPTVAPLPSQPATRVAGNTSPAPVPNEAISPPDAPAPTTQIAPSSFQLHYPPVGDGYVTGSSSQAMDDREAAKATGVLATVPLSQ